MTVQEYRQTRFTRPEGATEILLVRHGESRAARVDAPFALVDGQGDPELAPQGRVQAEQVGLRLQSRPINAVYVTKLQRTTRRQVVRLLPLSHLIAFQFGRYIAGLNSLFQFRCR